MRKKNDSICCQKHLSSAYCQGKLILLGFYEISFFIFRYKIMVADVKGHQT